MNGNILKVLKQITAQYGEDILGDARRIKSLFGDLAKDEPKPLRSAFVCCIEEGAYNALKTAPHAAERSSRKASIAQRVRDEHGLDVSLCGEALDILEAALFGEAKPRILCKSCGTALQEGWKRCPHCGAASPALPSPQPVPPPGQLPVLCKDCGNELQESWNMCLHCGAASPALFGDLAKDEPKPRHMVYSKWMENGFRRIVENAKTAEERREVIDGLALRLRDEEGLDIARCTETLELLAAISDVGQIAPPPPVMNTAPAERRTAKPAPESPPPAPPYCGAAPNWAAILTLQGHSARVRAAYSPDSRRIVSASRDQTIKIWDAESGAVIRTLKDHSSVENWGVYSGTPIFYFLIDISVAYRPDGRRIVATLGDMTIKIWDAESGDLIRTLQGHNSYVESAAYSPDGRRIVSASYDNTVNIWDAKSGDLIRSLQSHDNDVRSAAYRTDGRRIVSASFDKTVKIWDAEGGTVIRTLQGHDSGVESAAYRPDGRRVVSASMDNTVKIWDAETGDLIRTLQGHDSGVESAAYSPSGRRIVSASYDNTIKIWDAESGAVIRTLQSNVESAAYSPDGRRIVSASSDGTIKIWDAVE